MSTNTEGRPGFRDLLTREAFIIEAFMILAIAIIVAFCASWEFVQTWTPSVTTWSVIEKIQHNTLTTYWGLLVVPYIVMFAYLTSTLASWDKGTITANAKGRLSRRTPLVLTLSLVFAWIASMIVYLAVLWALAIPLPDIIDVIASSLLPFAALVLTSAMVLASLVMVNERGFTDAKGMALMTVLILAASGMLGYYWFM